MLSERDIQRDVFRKGYSEKPTVRTIYEHRAFFFAGCERRWLWRKKLFYFGSEDLIWEMLRCAFCFEDFSRIATTLSVQYFAFSERNFNFNSWSLTLFCLVYKVIAVRISERLETSVKFLRNLDNAMNLLFEELTSKLNLVQNTDLWEIEFLVLA